MDESKTKLLPLDGLRGIASSIVLLHHIRISFFSSTVETLENSIPRPFAWMFRTACEGATNGTLAVWVFWVLSGFVLSLQFFKSRSQPSSDNQLLTDLKTAIVRRYPRLMIPVLASVLFAWSILATGWMQGNQAASQMPEGSPWLAGLYQFDADLPRALKSALWDTFFQYDIMTTYNNVLWTMTPELQGSVLLFTVLFLCSKTRNRFVFYTVGIILLVIPRLETFLGGILLCDLFVNRDRLPALQGVSQSRFFRMLSESRAAAVLIWCGIIALGTVSIIHPGYLSIIAFLAVSLTLISAPTRRILGGKTPVYLGRISFGIYLVHVPILGSFSSGMYLKLSTYWGHYPTAVAVSLATIIVSVLAGALFHRWIDEPGVRLSKWIAGKVLKRSASAVA